MEAAEWSLDSEFITYLLSFEEGSVFSAMREVGMNIRPIDLDQEIDSFLPKSTLTFSEHGLIGVYFLTKTSPSGCSWVLSSLMMRKCCPVRK